MACEAVGVDGDALFRGSDVVAASAKGGAGEHVVRRRGGRRGSAVGDGRSRAAGVAGFTVDLRASFARVDGVNDRGFGGSVAGGAAVVQGVDGRLVGDRVTGGAIHSQPCGHPLVMDHSGIVGWAVTRGAVDIRAIGTFARGDHRGHCGGIEFAAPIGVTGQAVPVKGVHRGLVRNLVAGGAGRRNLPVVVDQSAVMGRGAVAASTWAGREPGLQGRHCGVAVAALVLVDAADHVLGGVAAVARSHGHNKTRCRMIGIGGFKTIGRDVTEGATGASVVVVGEHRIPPPIVGAGMTDLTNALGRGG